MDSKNITVYSFILLFILMGCATTASINKNMSKITYNDGIDKTEAKIIAKKKLSDAPFLGWISYRIIGPSVRSDKSTDLYPNYWFVEFSEKFYPDFFTEEGDSKYLIIIDKQTGEIKADLIYYPRKKQDIEWVVEHYKIDLQK